MLCLTEFEAMNWQKHKGWKKILNKTTNTAAESSRNSK
jgi:hypothetical protein